MSTLLRGVVKCEAIINHLVIFESLFEMRSKFTTKSREVEVQID